jgi:carbon starvation protein
VTKVLRVDDRRATPAERLDNDIDYQPTDRRILVGHHFAAIAGAGPLVGPVLAAQMGYLPGTMWIVFGVIFGGRRAGHGDPVLLDAPRRQESGTDGA